MREELGKLFRGKLIISLVLLSVLANFFLLFMQRDKISILRLLDNFTSSQGSVVSEEKMTALAELWKTSNTSGISWETFACDIEKASGYYDTIKSSDMADAYCSVKHLEGKAAEYVREEFHRLDSSMKRAAGQKITFFPPYRAQVFDFITKLLFVINLEGIMAAVIVTLYCLELERSSHTLLTVYSTRKGKRILREKLAASVAGSMVCYGGIAGVTFLAADFIFPVDTIVNTLVSNPMAVLKGMPCVMAVEMTIGQYLLASLGMSCTLTVVYSLGSFAVGLRVKNGYYAFGVLIGLLGIMKVISAAAPTSTCMFFWTQYNPLDLALKAGTWFLYGAAQFSPPGYEVCTTVLWMAVCAVGCMSELCREEQLLYL